MERSPSANNKIRKLEYPLVMGVLNLTVDSFSGDGVLDEMDVRDKVAQMLHDGVTCIDIGAESTRPGATRVGERAEKEKVVAAIKIIRILSKDILISVDTTRASVARAAIEEGADIINDISGGTFDPEMFRVIVENKNVFYVLGHVIGSFKTMHQSYGGNTIVEDVILFWKQKISELARLGVTSDRIICDPGIGFSKNLEENCQLIKSAAHLVQNAGAPVLFGISRKRFIKTISESEDNDSLDRYSLFLHACLLRDGVSIIRTHEVKHTINALSIFKTTYA